MRTLYKLKALQIKNAKPGTKHGDGGGLQLHVRHDGNRAWVFRYTLFGRRREMGLGSCTYVTLQQARQFADEARAMVRVGKDPIKEKRVQSQQHTLTDVTSSAFEARKSQLKNDGEAGKWLSPLQTHILPKLGKTPVSEISQHDIVSVLKPIWHTKHSAARKALGRLNIVLKHAAALDIDVDIQAVPKSRALLGKQKFEVKHIPSVPWPEVPTFYASLGDGPANLCLKLVILTAARSGEARGLNLGEIDGGIWTIPGARTKSGKEHRIPLSPAALEVIEQAKVFEHNGTLFPGRKGQPISDVTMIQIMKRKDMVERPHGFRSSFRTWLAEATDTPREIAEVCLAHRSGSDVELSYRRTDYIDQRRELMAKWGAYVCG